MAEVENQSLITSSGVTGVGAAVTKRIKHRFEQVLHGFQEGQLSLVWPDGTTNVYGERSSLVEQNADVVLHSYQPLRRLITDGQIGFAESYMRGEWSTESLPNLFSLIMRNEARIGPATRGGRFARLGNLWQHWTNRNSYRGSQRNIAYHYDLGNDFYQLWLDKSMSYSSAIYHSADETLEQAQQNKLDLIEQLLEAKDGAKVLEIGCGWGSLAKRLARSSNANVTGVSLSAEQLDYARAHKQADRSEPAVSASHSGKPKEQTGMTQFEHTDYRDVKGKFDHIVSIEMFEAVGEKYWNTYFNKLNELLESGGTAVIQTITIMEDRFNAYRSRPDFIQRYIFPGGMLPTKTSLQKQIDRAGFVLEHDQWFGDSYARTLAAWRERFERASQDVVNMDFDERFIRMWRYYLVYCETGFSIGHTDVGLLKIRKV